MNPFPTPAPEPRRDDTEISLDIESLSVSTHGVIVSVGAVEFDPRTDYLGLRYYQMLELDSQIKTGRVISASTLSWWMGQPDEVRNAIHALPRQWPILVLQELEKFIGERPVWTNGPAFDAAFLHDLADTSGVNRAWGHRQDRCLRTIKAMAPMAPKPDGETVAHNALEDALYQARQIQLCYRELRNPEPQWGTLEGDGTGQALPPIG